MGFVLVKIKHNDSQQCCTISYLHWIVISIACSTRLEVFQCNERKNITQKEKRKKEGENHQFLIDFKLLLGLRKPKDLIMQLCAPPRPPPPLLLRPPLKGGFTALPAEPISLRLRQACYARLYRPPKYFPVLPPALLYKKDDVKDIPNYSPIASTSYLPFTKIITNTITNS